MSEAIMRRAKALRYAGAGAAVLIVAAGVAAQSRTPATAPELPVLLGGYYSDLNADALAYSGHGLGAISPESPYLLYRHATSMLVQGKYRDAADLFELVTEDYPQSGKPYAAEAKYWRAFALQRLGTPADLKEASAALAEHRKLLEQQKRDSEASFAAQVEQMRTAYATQQKQMEDAVRQQTTQQQQAALQQEKQTTETIERTVRDQAEALARLKEQQENTLAHFEEQRKSVNESYSQQIANGYAGTAQTKAAMEQQQKQQLASLERQKEQTTAQYEQQYRSTAQSFEQQQRQMRESQASAKRQMEESLRQTQEASARSLSSMKEQQKNHLPSMEQQRAQSRGVYEAQLQRAQKLQQRIDNGPGPVADKP